jgi:uncharacterized protein YkwD
MTRKLGICAATLLAALFSFAATAQAGKYDRYLGSSKACPGANNAKASAGKQERTMRCLINFARHKKHLRKLKANSKLGKSARKKARVIDICNAFSHTPCGRTFTGSFRSAGYLGSRGWSVGENIAWMAPRAQATPRQIMRGWLYSSGHRHNIFTSKWRDQGVELRRVGRFAGYDDAVLWVSQFGVHG